MVWLSKPVGSSSRTCGSFPPSWRCLLRSFSASANVCPAAVAKSVLLRLVFVSFWRCLLPVSGLARSTRPPIAPPRPATTSNTRSMVSTTRATPVISRSTTRRMPTIKRMPPTKPTLTTAKATTPIPMPTPTRVLTPSIPMQGRPTANPHRHSPPSPRPKPAALRLQQ